MGIILILMSTGLSLASPKGVVVDLRDYTTGRKIVSRSSMPGDIITFTWNNSLFRLKVTEVYIVKEGFIEQTSVTFHDPNGKKPPVIRPEEVDDFYHTGGPFIAEGIARPFKKIIFLIGDYGNPVLKIGDSSIRFKEEVGFGGAVILEVKGYQP